MEDIFHGFMNGATGNRPDDYYFMYNSKGAKYFYSRITGKRVQKASIPTSFHDKIKEKDPGLDIGHLVSLKNGYLIEIARLKAKVEEIDVKLNTINPNMQEECKRQKEEQDRKDEARRKEYKREREELLRRYEQQFNKKPPPKEENDILQQLNIKSKKEWKEWLVKNHPDRGGDDELCGKVIAAGRSKVW